MARVEQTCHCGKKFTARKADVDRGWAKCCSKSCAATKSNRETGKFDRHRRRTETQSLDDFEWGHPLASGYEGHGQE
jgi:hypothetical protein